MTPAVHIPVDLQRRGYARLFARALGHADADLLLFRLWMEWAGERKEWRPLAVVPQSGSFPLGHPWEAESLAWVIEDAAGWKGQTGGLLTAALESGVLRLDLRAGLSGLVLTDFWPANEHLSADFVPIHRRGGLARQARRRDAEAAGAAAEVERVHVAQEVDLFDSTAEATAEERSACYTLLLRLDRACARETRQPSEYTPGLMLGALGVVRAFSAKEIDAVVQYLIASRGVPSVVKVPDRIVEDFNAYLHASRDLARLTA